MPSQETIDRNTRAVKDALKREGNRRCADCAARGPTVACIAFRTFVCQPCANAHRELFPDNKLKSVSLAEFETDEVRGLRQHGNAASRKIWLARWAPSDGEPPAGAPREALKRFLSRKYVDKAWVAGGQPAPPPVPAPRPVAPPPANELAARQRDAECGEMLDEQLRVFQLRKSESTKERKVEEEELKANWAAAA